MTDIAAPPATLMGLWQSHKRECRGVGGIVADARAGKLPGVEPFPSGYGFAVTDHKAALSAMRKVVP
ncbi:hypothetical protein BFN67_13815 [Pseudaminobacter manganicus]|uniref:Uncharacterized protein n=1 Tax=Manganibacter manganicus TaxID=1873176 RepID=A0A1V8RTV8_9HYPH|nr:hypothetical protein BFN67_13815 [Pseudaminobacter manganicus]